MRRVAAACESGVPGSPEWCKEHGVDEADVRAARNDPNLNHPLAAAAEFHRRASQAEFFGTGVVLFKTGTGFGQSVSSQRH